MSVANHLAVAMTILELPMRIDPLGDFRFHGLRQQTLGSVTENIGQHVVIAGRWQGNDRIATLSHGGVLRGNVALSKPNSNPSTPPSSTQLIHNFQI